MSYDIVQHTEKLSTLLAAETPFVMVTLLDIRGSAPQIIGAKAIVSADGIEHGTVGGGKIEAAAVKFAQKTLNTTGNNTELVTWNLQTDVGMTCGGEVKLLFEAHRFSEWPIAVFGAGHIAQSLVPLLVQLHCKVTCVDSRAEWLNKLDDHPRLRKQCVEIPCELVRDMPADTFFVLMSQGHATDLPVLAEILTTRTAQYVGVIGSQQKASVLRRDLAQQNISKDKIDSFYCPMGLPIGNNTPAEIAISVSAQLIQIRDSQRSEQTIP